MTTIQAEAPGGGIVEHTTRAPVKQTIFSEIHNKRYMMAGEAPICNGNLFDAFGYTANTTAGWAVLDGTYVAPDGTDQATLDLAVAVAETVSTFRRIQFPYASPPNNGSDTGR